MPGLDDYNLLDALKALIDEVAFDAAVLLNVARRCRVQVPLDIDMVNERSQRIRDLLDQAFAEEYAVWNDTPSPGWQQEASSGTGIVSLWQDPKAPG